MNAPLVTIGLPFHDEEKHLADAIRSILRQTMRDFELLVIDDGSRDRSVEIARSIADPRITVVSDGQRRHLAARLNQVIDRARGRFIARMDADDVAHPERLARQLAALEADPAAAASGTWAGLVDDDERAFAVVEASPQPVSAARTLEQGVLPHPTLLARTEWFAAHRYDERATRTEDRDLWCRSASTTRFAIVPEVLYVLRVEAREDGFVRTYIETQRQNRQLFLRYGPTLLGWRGTARAWSATFAKSAAMEVAERVGLSDRVVRRRGRRPTPAELVRIEEALGSAR